MKLLKLTAAFLLISVIAVFAQKKSFLTYYDLDDFLQTSPGSFKFGLYGYSNPAITNFLHDNDILINISDRKGIESGSSRWGVFTGTSNKNPFFMIFPNYGMGLIHVSDSGRSIYDFRYSQGYGSKSFGFGIGYGYTFGDKKYFNRSSIIYWGAIARPLRNLSIGVQQTIALEKSEYESVFDIGIRPIGNYPLTFFADYSMFNKQNLEMGNWSVGVSYEFLDGVRLNGRYFKNKAFALSFDFSFGNFGLATQSHFDKDNKYDYNSYSIRLGAWDRTIIDKLSGGKQYAKFDLSGSVRYQKFLWFDNSNTLIDILKKIDVAKNDNSIKGIVINCSGFNINMELAWEIREKLKEFKETGKKVVVFIDRAGIQIYHFASVADKIIMDPFGGLSLEGYMLGRSYYKSMLEKLGIGFEELRYFKYKSAAESFARDKMSDADREQRQKLVDDWYAITRKDVCNSRGFSELEFDSLVNNNLIYLPKDALEKKLIDTIGRWVDAEEILRITDKDIKFVSSNSLSKDNEPLDNKWGEAREYIAIVYAIGECAMDNGIKARTLVNDLKRAAENNHIKAIVLRVDSPGGDAMASDYLADIIRQFKDKKPIIVSQGMVAASGGYWISMDANKIVAAPMTITGSIGVIGSWFYDKGMKDDLGITTDVVKAGKYADFGQSFSLPFIGIGLPIRNLNEDEKSQIEKMIKTSYKEFTSMVAVGRKMTTERVDSIGQGRVWSGLDGKENGLVDELGGLCKAIELAKQEAGIAKEEDVALVEYPKPGLFDFSFLFSSMFGVNLNTSEKQLKSLKFRLEHIGTPMPVMPLEYYDFVPEK